MSFKSFMELATKGQGDDSIRIAYQNPEIAGQIDIFNYENIEAVDN